MFSTDVQLCVVVGMGNVLMSDEGVGVCVVRQFLGFENDFPGVSFVEVGSSMMGALHSIAGKQKAVFVDCAFMNQKPGSMRRFVETDVRSKKVFDLFSVHGTGLFDVLKISRELKECPASIVIFGVEPELIAPGEGLSETLNSHMSEYKKMVSQELMNQFD